jgi:peptide methionine sulfoxide reductase msrA/msrB
MMGFNELTPEERRIIQDKGTEQPFSGKFVTFDEKGDFVCKRCDAPLYRSEDKFDAHCGWPSFDNEIPGAVKRVPDADGRRTEIVCNSCDAHLGHVFLGEQLTDKDVRHCVNSISLNFRSTAEAVFAAGCFWGVEHYFREAEGVLTTEVGYMGGQTQQPTYEEVCSGSTRHAEVLSVTFDPSRTDYETLARLFFEIHDPTQLDRQGPDVGDQYRSAIFYKDAEQLEIAQKLIGILKEKGLDVVTELVEAQPFWKAEDYHQEYYKTTGKQPYCHFRTKRF